VGDGDFAAGGVVDGKDRQVLDKRAAAPDVEDLNTEADGEDGLVEVVGVLEEELIDVFAGAVAGGALGDGILTVLVGVDVGGTAGEENGLAGIDEVGDFYWRREEGNLDGLAATALDSERVLGPGALVVGDIGAGGDRNRDAGTGIGEEVIRAKYSLRRWRRDESGSRCQFCVGGWPRGVGAGAERVKEAAGSGCERCGLWHPRFLRRQ
jgi:hypothetical protein